MSRCPQFFFRSSKGRNARSFSVRTVVEPMFGTHGLLSVGTIYVLSLFVFLFLYGFPNAEKQSMHPLFDFAIHHAECTPVQAVFCDDGLACQSGMTGYTCGELSTAAVVPVGAPPPIRDIQGAEERVAVMFWPHQTEPYTTSGHGS